MKDLLKEKTLTNLSYNILCRLFVFTLSSATGIILARNLTSSDYGIVGFAMIFIGFLQQFNDLGVTPSIIQKQNIEDKDIYTAFTLKILLGILVFSLSFAWGSLSQKAFDNPAVKPVIIVLSAGLLTDCLGFVPTTTLARELEFKRLVFPQLASQVTATAVAITAVYLGFRYWSIVFSNLSASVASVAIVFALRPVPLKLTWNWETAKGHLKFGSHIFLSGLLVFILFNVDNFIIGAVGGASTLGFYAVAYNWSTKATGFIGQAISNILLSTFSRVQQDLPRLKRGYLAVLEYVSFGAILANVTLFIVSRELLIIVLGGGTEKWLTALLALNVLCLYGAIRAILEPVGNMIIAIGRPALILKSNAIVAALQVACLYPTLKYFGIGGVAVAVTISYAVQFFIYFPVLRREIDLPYSLVFRSIRPALAAGIVLVVFGFSLDRFIITSWLSLVVKVAFGCSLYMVTYGWITEWKLLKEMREIIGTSFLKPSQSSI